MKSGDEVIVFEPAFDAYVPIIQLHGGIPVFVSLKHPDYHIDWDEAKDAMSSKTRLIILNSPHNPSGAVLSREDISALRDLTDKSDVMILSDEVYEHIIFDGFTHEDVGVN